MKQKKLVFKLNNAQKQIVEFMDGSVLVSAGPGSGKTRSIVERIVHMIKSGIKPESILATTFTKKAANEMNERLTARKIDISRMSVQTMHSLCWRIIRENKHFKGWQVDDRSINRIVLKNIIGYKQLNWQGVDISTVETFISFARNNVVAPEESGSFMTSVYRSPLYAQAYMMYAEQMAERRLITFDDMLYYGVKTLQGDLDTLNKEQARYRYVMVDEFQDSNQAQLVLAELLAAPEFNYMAVGDIDQAIYSWRGALPEFMLDFKDKYDAEMIELSTNYRCAPAIMKVADACIRHNQKRFSKVLIAHRTSEATITLIDAADSDDEALHVKDAIQMNKHEGVGYGDMRVLMRVNAQSRAIEEILTKTKIPYVVFGSVSFYERKEIKDLLCYLRLLINPNDVVSGEYALNRPFRFVGRQMLDTIRQMHDSSGSYINAVATTVAHTRLQGALDFVHLMKSFNVEEDKPSEILREIVKQTDYVQYLMREEGTDTLETSRAGNIQELINSAERFSNCSDLIDHIDMQIKLRKRAQHKKDDNRVQIMTIHKAKGTEADTVFIIGANEAVIPHAKGDVEEERRLFYVAMTRAKNRLYVSTIHNEHSVQPSRFIYEAGILNDNLTTDNKEDMFIQPVSEDHNENTGIV